MIILAHAEHKAEPRIVGRYALYDKIASGGMASVHFGRLLGAAGFQRTVAIKRLHPQYVHDDEFATQFIDEARLAAHIAHKNVVQVLDVVSLDDELLLVMEYVHGETLSRLMSAAAKRGEWIPTAVAAAALSSALNGLHAAHEACDDAGNPLGIVHRDISPQNVLLGCDGAGRVLDFGVAKARLRVHSTEGHQLKGKLRYMAPEQVLGKELDRRTDVFAAGVVLWRLLTGRHLFGEAEEPATTLFNVLEMPIPKPSSIVPRVPPELDAITLRALCREPEGRYQTAQELANALTGAVAVPSVDEIGRWIERVCGDVLAERAALLSAIVRHSQQHAGDSVSKIRVLAAGNAGPREPRELEPGSTNGAEGRSPPGSASAGAADDASDWGTERVTGGGWMERVSLTQRVAASHWKRGRWVALGAAAAAIIGFVLVARAPRSTEVPSRHAAAPAAAPGTVGVTAERGDVREAGSSVVDLDGRTPNGAAAPAPQTSAEPAPAPAANPKRPRGNGRASISRATSAPQPVEATPAPAPAPSAAVPFDPLRRRD